MILLIVGLVGVLGKECPKFECEELAKNVCAFREGAEIRINQEGCLRGFICEYKEIELWYAKIEDELSQKLMCYKQISTSRRLSKASSKTKGVNDSIASGNFSTTDYEFFSPSLSDQLDLNSTSTTDSPVITSKYIDCPDRNQTHELKKGSHPKPCESEDDCELIDGSKSECQCSMNGKSFCKPKMSSSIFEVFWEICEDKKMTEKIMNEWKLVENEWIPSLNEPECAELVLSDLAIVGLVNLGDETITVDIDENEHGNDDISVSLAVSIFLGLILLA